MSRELRAECVRWGLNDRLSERIRAELAATLDHLAVLVACLEGQGDEELFDHASAAYCIVSKLRAELEERAR